MLNQNYGNLTRYRLLEQGDAALSFYKLAAQAEAVVEQERHGE
jgi:hypothetical protein